MPGPPLDAIKLTPALAEKVVCDVQVAMFSNRCCDASIAEEEASI